MTIENVNWNHCIGILTEAGILLEDGSIIAERNILKLTKEAKCLYDAKDYEDFMKLVFEIASKELNEKEWFLFGDTVIDGYNKTIFMAAQDIEDILDKKRGRF
jgi:hypothetical protein